MAGAGARMTTTYSLNFSSPPKSWALYPRILIARKPRHVHESGAVPRIEATLERFAVDRAHLADYRAVCACAEDDVLPIAYPHVLAMPLHISILASDAFPVQLLGLVHLRNRIVQRRPLGAAESGTIHSSIEGHRETERGQEFELHTRIEIGGESVWEETCTFLARGRSRAGGGLRGVRAAAPARAGWREDEVAGPARTTSFHVPGGLGRRYAWVSGDFNPIHMADMAAKPFGFDRAVVHGMWSLARCAAEFPARHFARPCELDVSFRLPVFLPSWLQLQTWETSGGHGFALRDSAGERQHLTGTLLALQ